MPVCCQVCKSLASIFRPSTYSLILGLGGGCLVTNPGNAYDSDLDSYAYAYTSTSGTNIGSLNIYGFGSLVFTGKLNIKLKLISNLSGAYTYDYSLNGGNSWITSAPVPYNSIVTHQITLNNINLSGIQVKFQAIYSGGNYIFENIYDINASL